MANSTVVLVLSDETGPREYIPYESREEALEGLKWTKEILDLQGLQAEIVEEVFDVVQR